MVGTSSCTRLKGAAQQLRLVAELKRRRAQNHRFVATLFEAAGRPLLKQKVPNAEPIRESAQTRDGPA